MRKTFATLTLCGLLLSACQGGREAGSNVLPGDSLKAGDSVLAQCAINSPLRELGAGLDAPGRIENQPPPAQARPASATLNSGSCAGNESFFIGVGSADMTGPAADSISAGYESPSHVLNGIHLRQFARAFALASPCNGQRVVMVVTETGFMTAGTRQTVLDLIAADDELAPWFGPQNVMLSATHTHSGPGGEAHHEAYNLFRLGYDDLVHEIYTQAIYEAIRQAHEALMNQPQPGRVQLQVAELLDANINRSVPAFENNPAAERQQWLDARGAEIQTGKRMLQLRFDAADGSPLGLLNWFPVHTTSVGTHESLISSDNKGLAALGFESLMREQNAQTDFVAAFAQAGHGDTSPNLCLHEHPYPDIRIGCGEDTLQSTAAHGVKQLARAIEMYDAGGLALRGGIESRLFHAPMDQIEVTDPVILDSLAHPPELDEGVKRTCTAALGYSMAAGAEDQRGVTQEGITCRDTDYLAGLEQDIQVALNSLAGGATSYPALPSSTFGGLVGCGLTGGLGALPGLPDADYSCHAEKPILFPIGSTELISNSDLPLQILALGNLAVVGLPWEVTTTSARRIRQTVMQELRGADIEYVVVASMSNDFVQYLTTREEYATQQYEGASTHFGPWTLAAVQQELRKLAISLRDGAPAPQGAELARSNPGLTRAAYRAGDARPQNGDFGDVLSDAQESYQAGDTVEVIFAAAHPRNDTLEKRGASYLYVDHIGSDGSRETVAMDRDPGLIMHWSASPASPVFNQGSPWRQSELRALWHSPANLPAGQYQLRYEGTAVPAFDQPDAGQTLPFVGLSRVFQISAGDALCPGYPAWF